MTSEKQILNELEYVLCNNKKPHDGFLALTFNSK